MRCLDDVESMRKLVVHTELKHEEEKDYAFWRSNHEWIYISYNTVYV